MSLLFASANHSHSEVTLPDHFHPLFTTIKSMMDLQAPKKSNVPELDFSVDKVILFCCAAFSDLAEVICKLLPHLIYLFSFSYLVSIMERFPLAEIL